MASDLIEANRKDAEIVYGDELGQKVCAQMLEELEAPNGLLALKNILEVGVNRKNGFVWALQKEPTTHFFHKVGELVQYSTTVTCFCSKQRARKVTGVKTKELLFWVSIGDIHLHEKDSSKIVFKNLMTGFTRTHPFSAFEREEEGEEKKIKEGEDKEAEIENKEFPLSASEEATKL